MPIGLSGDLVCLSACVRLPVSVSQYSYSYGIRALYKKKKTVTVPVRIKSLLSYTEKFKTNPITVLVRVLVPKQDN